MRGGVDGLDDLGGGGAGGEGERRLDHQLAPQQRRGEDAHQPDRRPPRRDRPAGKLEPMSVSAGTGPQTPATKPMIAADEAVVWVMLFSSAL